MNSLVNLSNAIANDTAVSMQKFNDLNSSYLSDLTSLHTELQTSLLSSSLKKIQTPTDYMSQSELTKSQNQLICANLNAGITAFSQFLSVSGSYRNKIHTMAEASLLALGDNNRS